MGSIVSDDGELEPYDYLAPEVVAARAAVGRAIAEYLAVIRPTEQPYIVAWAAAAEWTNTELEQTGQASRDVISPSEQTISASAGLGSYLHHRFE
jgi:hypothetical protein